MQLVKHLQDNLDFFLRKSNLNVIRIDSRVLFFARLSALEYTDS